MLSAWFHVGENAWTKLTSFKTNVEYLYVLKILQYAYYIGTLTWNSISRILYWNVFKYSVRMCHLISCFEVWNLKFLVSENNIRFQMWQYEEFLRKSWTVAYNRIFIYLITIFNRIFVTVQNVKAIDINWSAIMLQESWFKNKCFFLCESDTWTVLIFREK